MQLKHHKKSTPLSLMATRVALFIIALTPIIFYRPIFQYYVASKAFFIFGFSEIAIIAYISLMHTRPAYKPKQSVLSLILIGFILIQILASVLGVDPWNSFWSQPGRMTGVFLLLHILGLFFVLITTFRSQTIWRHFLFFNILIGFFVLFFYWFPIFQPLIQEANGGSTLGNSTYFGTYILFLILFATLLLLDKNAHYVIRLAAITSLIASTYTLFATDARAAKIALLGAVIFGCGQLCVSLGKRARTRFAGRSIIAILIASFLWISVSIFIPGTRAYEYARAVDGPTRFTIWHSAWEAIADRPILGWGPENFSHVSLRFYNPCIGSEACGYGKWSDRAHNILLETTVGSGVIGLIFYLGIFFSGSIMLLKRKTENANNKIVSIVLISFLAAYLVQNLTGFDSVVSLLLLFITLAYIHYLSTQHTHVPMGQTKKSASHAAARAPLGILAIVLLPIGLWYFVIQPFIGFTSPTKSIQAREVNERLDAYNNAVNTSRAGLSYRR